MNVKKDFLQTFTHTQKQDATAVVLKIFRNKECQFGQMQLVIVNLFLLMIESRDGHWLALTGSGGTTGSLKHQYQAMYRPQEAEIPCTGRVCLAWLPERDPHMPPWELCLVILNQMSQPLRQQAIQWQKFIQQDVQTGLYFKIQSRKDQP